jgi:hypothetical protein
VDELTSTTSLMASPERAGAVMAILTPADELMMAGS